MKTYPIAATRGLIDLLNENGSETLMSLISELPKLMPAVERLNKRVLNLDNAAEGEGFSPWVAYINYGGRLAITVDQPHYLKKGVKRTWTFDGRRFV